GVPDFDTLRVLNDYRGLTAKREVPFGVYGEVLEPGRVRLGDRAEPLELSFLDATAETQRMASVVHPAEVEPRREGNLDVRTTFDNTNGCERLEQRVVRIGRGPGPERRLAGRQEILYVAAGHGTLHLGGDTHVLEPDMGVYIARDETYSIEADDELTIISVVTRADADSAQGRRKVTVRFADQPELDATSVRTFRYLVNEDAGCSDVTQFLGIVQPRK